MSGLTTVADDQLELPGLRVHAQPGSTQHLPALPATINSKALLAAQGVRCGDAWSCSCWAYLQGR